MNAQGPSDHVRELVESFLAANDLRSAVGVTYGRTSDGDDLISIQPRAEGAADLVLRITVHGRRYTVYVFVAGETRPIEIAGPINVNADPPRRSADEDLLEVLQLVVKGEVFDEVDEEGSVLGTDVPDPRTAGGSVESTEHRRWYKPWS
ncbi:hypothetical protein [Blastococcus saxobsidens]|uniref:YbjN domain-containing protein n=1 Tax=Blastococcus saxobsidens (strain DD2) TaxID=1146883 RepID=H6RVF3_BLASD|nr:hypothetical protein [Blastococcus saxobsidens]CCG02030.1 protein of unknown function [Blastococcus saxobsidens DD2]